MVNSYSDFIEKLIHAGRRDGIEPYFRFGEEIDRDNFIKFANKFIEHYYATVPPDFARKHPMKFSFGTLSQDGLLNLNRTITSREIDQYPKLNIGLLFLEPQEEGKEEGTTLDASVFRQACFIQREERKFWITIIGVVAAVTIPFAIWLLSLSSKNCIQP